MDINKLIKDAHENSIKHGFYDCYECKGSGCDKTSAHDQCSDDHAMHECRKCQSCNGTGIDQHANIPEKLMLIVSELSEAQEALRKNKRCKISEKEWYDFFNNYPTVFDVRENKYENIIFFESSIKNTFEDEIADVYIRLADLCGYLGINLCPDALSRKYIFNRRNINQDQIFKMNNISEMFFEIDYLLHIFYRRLETGDMVTIFNALNTFCDMQSIDIDKHITAKMAYNATRTYKHGKEL